MDEDRPEVTAQAWIIMKRQTKQIIAGKKSDLKREIASITQVMTCIATLNLVKKLKIDMQQFFIRVSKEAAQMPGTSAELQEGDWASVKDLLHGLMLPSGNDAAYALAEGFGSFLYVSDENDLKKIFSSRAFDIDKCKPTIQQCAVPCFIQEMNRIAKEINLQNTNFSCPHGLANQDNLSTAFDVALISTFALQNDIIRQIVSTQEYTCYVNPNEEKEREMVWENTNDLLFEDQAYKGLQTGITIPAGGCLSTHYQQFHYKLVGDIDIITVVLGSKDTEERFQDTKELIEWIHRLIMKGNY